MPQSFGKPIDQNLVFKVDLLDQSSKPKQLVELLYLISREAQRKGELEGYYEKRSTLSGDVGEAVIACGGRGVVVSDGRGCWRHRCVD